MKRPTKPTKQDEPKWEVSAEEQLRVAYRELGKKYEALKKMLESAPEPNMSVHIQYGQEIWMVEYARWWEDSRRALRSAEEKDADV